jgi:signal recognition particle subunit SRP54
MRTPLRLLRRRNAVIKAKAEGYDTVLVDTAGRQVIDTDLMKELQQIKDAVQPVDTLLVVDAMTWSRGRHH